VGTLCSPEKVLIVQIYEIQTPSEAESMIELGVDHIGSVILSETDWKDPLIYDTVRLSQAAGRCSSLIPLFKTFEMPGLIIKVLEYYRPDIVHFCDSLTNRNGIRKACLKMVDLQKTIKIRWPQISIMRSIPIAPPGMSDKVPTLELTKEFEKVSDFFLTDTLMVDQQTNSEPIAIEQPVEGFIGITGRTCDWAIARRLVEISSVPVILAGGISADNVEAGISQVGPAGVDSCTGTNAINGSGHPMRFKKDLNRVKKLVEAVRRFNS
jgi:phosphoribosylanthranilate isomerase